MAGFTALLLAGPAVFAAARQSLEFRGVVAAGWSMGWKINLWARFRDGDRASITSTIGGPLHLRGKVEGKDQDTTIPTQAGVTILIDPGLRALP